MGKYIQLIKKLRKIYGAACRNAGRVIIYRIITEKKKISNSRTLFTLTSWNFLPPSAIMKLRKAFLCVVCEQGRKKLCAGGNCSDIFQ